MFFTASDFTSITSHTHNWVLFLLWLCPFILYGVTSPLTSSIKFIFQCPFHTVHGVLKARILKWFPIPFPIGPHSVQLFTMTHPFWVTLHSIAHSFIELDKAVIHRVFLIADDIHLSTRKMVISMITVILGHLSSFISATRMKRAAVTPSFPRLVSCTS